MPVNMRTHGHGQGYADLNFLIPELIGSIRVRKGPYFADEGDFSSAGAIHIDYLDSLKQGFAQVTTGSFGYNRLLAAKSGAVGEGTLLAAVEANTYNGPWQVPDEVRKFNGLVRYSQGNADNGFSILGAGLYQQMEFHRSGGAARDRQRRDRPLRLARSDRRRQVEPRQPVRPLGPHRGQRADPGGGLRDPPDHDAVQQLHVFPRRSGQRRPVQPVRPPHRARRQRQPHHQESLRPVRHREHRRRAGAPRRHRARPAQDLSARDRCRPCASDRVEESSVGVYAQNTTRWTDWMRTVTGIRGDYFTARVNSDNAGELRQHRRLHGEPEGQPDLRAVPQDRIVPQRRHRLSLQRRARLDHHGRSRRQASRRCSRCRCWCAPRAPRSASARRRSTGSTVRWRCSCSTMPRRFCSSATPAPPSRAVRAAASASNGPTITR